MLVLKKRNIKTKNYNRYWDRDTYISIKTRKVFFDFCSANALRLNLVEYPTQSPDKSRKFSSNEEVEDWFTEQDNFFERSLRGEYVELLNM